MSQGLCPSCGAAVNLTAGQTETKCQYCETVVTLQQAEAQFAEVKNSKFRGTLLIAETAQEGGSYTEALNYYNKVIEQQPDFADAWLNKGICMVRTSKIGDLRIAEAISSWKAAIKFAKSPEAMKKRVATEINNAVSDFYPVLEDHYLRFHNLDDSLREHGNRFLLLESALSLAMELSPTATIAKNGLSLCDRFVGSIKTAAGSNANDVSVKLLFQQDWKGALSSAFEAGSKEKVASDLAQALRVTRRRYEQSKARLDPSRTDSDQTVGAIDALQEQFDCERDVVEVAIAKFQKQHNCTRDEAIKMVQEKAKNKPKSGCFVATACYGNHDHPVVMELRHFRDECLGASTAGRAFVGWYYQWSPAFASLVAKNRILKTLAKVLIVTPAVAVARIINTDAQKD